MNHTAGFDFSDKVIIVTGGTGVLLKPTVHTLVELGAQLILLSRTPDEQLTQELVKLGKPPVSFSVDVTQKERLISARAEILGRFGRVDILINGAGGNQAGATTSEERSFFDLPDDAVEKVFDVNFLGSFYASQVFGELMTKTGSGVILNISSMAAIKPLTRVSAYSAAKAAINNFTQWLAVHMAQEYSEHIRVNAISPGFLLTEQNRFLVTTPDGGLTERGQQIIEATPMARFGEPEEMIGTILWLISDAAKFVTGIVVPVDGGFSAFGGV
jgi:NAD(P)-dependent dehydrogenase (short-subunit alcohol dehydrogenase family)